MNTIRAIQIFILTFLFWGQILAQGSPSVDFMSEIKQYDLSSILTADSIIVEDSEEEIIERAGVIQRAEILGFIGDNYQRLQIHFISIIQNQNNPLEYFAFGKTKVKNNICTFQGLITIRNARTYEIAEIPTYKQGFVICDVILYEDKKLSSTGYFQGELKSNFIIDVNENFRYDALMFMADGFANNQFVGNWTSYKTKVSKACHWGDYRIPESGNLDIGAGEFSINEDYVKNGWENYVLAWGTYPETSEVIKARKIENMLWWKN